LLPALVSASAHNSLRFGFPPIWEYGEAGALARRDYAKAVLISEATRLMLREIEPVRRKKNKKGTIHD